MSDPQKDAGPAATLVLDYELEAPVDTVWRAISASETRERWLPDRDLADPEPVHAVPGEEVRYRMRDAAPPHLESIVTFRIAPGLGGGTRLTIVHDLTDARLTSHRLVPANTDRGPVMLAA